MTQSLMRFAVGSLCTTAITAALMANTESVQAMTFDRLLVTGVGRLENTSGDVGSFAKIDFFDLSGPISSGPMAGTGFGIEDAGGALSLTPLVIQDIDQLEKTFTDPNAPILAVENRWERDWGSGSTFRWLTGDDWTFTLTRLVVRQFNHENSTAPIANAVTGDVFGYFTFSDASIAPNAVPGNALSSQSGFVLNANGDAFSGNLSTPIPTPAMLPGIFAFGTAAWRKRKVMRRGQFTS